MSVKFKIRARLFQEFHMDWTLEDAQLELDDLELLITCQAERDWHDVLIETFVNSFELELADNGYITFG